MAAPGARSAGGMLEDMSPAAAHPAGKGGDHNPGHAADGGIAAAHPAMSGALRSVSMGVAGALRASGGGADDAGASAGGAKWVSNGSAWQGVHEAH